MTTRHRRAAARVAAGAVSLFAALAMTALPAYAEDPAEPSESPAPSASAEPAPTETPPASESPDPGGSTKPAGPPSGTPAEPGDVPQPPVRGDGEAGEEDEEPKVDLAVSTPGSKVTVGSPGKWVRIDVDNWSFNPARNVQLTVEVGDLSDQVDVELPGEDFGCEVEGSRSVCQYPDLAGNDTDTFVNVKVTPKPDAKEGPAGTVRLTLTSESPDSNPDNNEADVQIELVGSGPDLTAYAGQVGPVKPGRSATLFHGFANQGDETASGFAITIELPRRHTSLVERYVDCAYSSDGRKVTCAAPDFPIEPGEFVDLTGSFHVKVSKRAPGPVVLGRGAFSVTPLGSSASAAVKASGKGSGSFLAGRSASMRASGGDMVEGDNTVTFAVKTSKNGADLAIKAIRAEGAKGDIVTVKFVVTNHGPANLSGFHLTLTAPTGADIKGSPYPSEEMLDCSEEYGGHLDNREAGCNYLNSLPAGATFTFTVRFVIVADEVSDDGRATVGHSSAGGDPRRKNNTATVVIGPPGSTGGGGGGLPVTGASLGGLVGGGAMALLLGGALLMVARWRRAAGSAVIGGDAA